MTTSNEPNRVIASNNATPQPKLRWQRSDAQLYLPIADGPAMHHLVNTFKYLEDAKQRGDQGEINEYKIFLLRLIATYNLRAVADRFHLQPLLRLIDDLQRDPPPNFVKLGRKSRSTPPNPIDIICHALFMLNPMAMPLTQFYKLVFPFGAAKLPNYTPPSFQTISTRRYTVLNTTERLMMLNRNGAIVKAAARAFGDHAPHIHPDTGQQYCQLRSCPKEISESMLYTFHAQAWAMRTYAGILKEHGRTSCPFLTGTLEKSPMGEPTTGQLLFKNDGLHGSMRAYILCYKTLQQKIIDAANRSRPAFILPYFVTDGFGQQVMHKVHLHNTVFRSGASGAGRKYTRIVDVIRILTTELQAEYGIASLDIFAEQHGLERINILKIPTDVE